MGYADVQAFMARLRERDGGIAARALAFVILAACRTNEVHGATWDEIDLGSQVWTSPATRMKAGREHRVPLSEAAARLLEDMARIRVSEFDFPSLDMRSRGPLSNMALAMVLRHGRRKQHGPWVPLGLPRLVRRGDKLPARDLRGSARPCFADKTE